MSKCSVRSVKFMSDLFESFSTEEMEILWLLLKKLYSFDGEEQDGFEENINFEINEDENQDKVLNEFIKRRNERR